MPAKIKAWLVFWRGAEGKGALQSWRADTEMSAETQVRSVRGMGCPARAVSVELDESELLLRPEDSPKVKVELH